MVQDQLMEMNGNFPNPLPSELLEIRADTWYRGLKEVFHKIDEGLFLKACSYHLQNNEFYPVLKNIIDGYRNAAENKPKLQALPEPRPEFTPEEEDERDGMIRKFRNNRNKKIGG